MISHHQRTGIAMNISHESDLDQTFNAGFKVGMILGTTLATLVLVALNLLLRSFA